MPWQSRGFFPTLARMLRAFPRELSRRVCVTATILLLLTMCMGAEAAKKKKVKTTFKALKCSACKAVAEEIKQEVEPAHS